MDPGSQVSIATEKLRKKLKLDGYNINYGLSGIGNSRIKINNRLQLKLRSKTTNSTNILDNKITSQQPQNYISRDHWQIPNNIKLADPDFNVPKGIDLLLGIELYGELMLPNHIKLGNGLPTLQNSTLGWLIMGAFRGKTVGEEAFCGNATIDLNNQLTRFWTLQDYIPRKLRTKEEQKCEALFDASTVRREGRFNVKIPLKASATVLGDSKGLAYKRLMALERKFKNHKELKEQYVQFLRDYEQKGHMKEIASTEIQGPHYYLPHHCVLKPSSSTTKLRVVFDASAKTTNNIALNEIMMSGPKVQDDLFAIILRFRTRRYVFTAVIQQMYRQILVATEDRNLQLILWRENEGCSIKTFTLNTVTYGTKSAPYLATKCLERLAEEEEVNYPIFSKAVRDFYVDDIITGVDDINEALEIQKQVCSLLKAGGFLLRKWCANHPRLLEDISVTDMELQLDFTTKEDDVVKPLGLIWHPISDEFQIKVKSNIQKIITKRSVLSKTASLFDPLGLINPVVVRAKIFMQQLWKLKIDWDEELPRNMRELWEEYENELQNLHNLLIPRYVFVPEHTGRIVLHAFADASERAYGTAIYLSSKDKTGASLVRLLCARSRVAPLKQTKLPLLELCAALMTAELVKIVIQHLNISLDDVFYWSDSEIVLSWINRDAATLKTFVANRIADIQTLTDTLKWRYVPSHENPADMVSRRCSPQQLCENTKWFTGPEFLKTPQREWPKQPQHKIMTNEFEKILKCLLNTSKSELCIIDRVNHGNSFQKLQRVMASVIRAIRRFKLKTNHHANLPEPTCVTTEELDAATLAIITMIQHSEYSSELRQLQQGKSLTKNNSLTS